LNNYVTVCQHAQVIDTTGRTGAVSIDQAFLNAWLTPNPNGACEHLATYSTEEEFNAIVQSIIDAGGSAAIIGGRRDPTGSAYQWATGTIRGQNWIDPYDSTSGADPRGARCNQQFCLRDMLNARPITDVSQVGMALVVTDQLNPLLVPSSGADCYTVEINTVSYIANVDGGPPLQVVPALLNFDTHQRNAIMASSYIARVSSATQNQWIKDELQCGVFNVWLGYETSTVSHDLRLSAGPGEGTIIEPAGSTVCTGTYYCNLPNSAITLSDAAVKFLSTTGAWSMAAQSTTASALRQSDVCPNLNGQVPMCAITSTSSSATSGITLQYMNPTTAATQYALSNAFYAGGPFQKTVSGTTYLFYFDCNCNTDYRVDKGCLASTNPSLCSIYTEAI